VEWRLLVTQFSSGFPILSRLPQVGKRCDANRLFYAHGETSAQTFSLEQPCCSNAYRKSSLGFVRTAMRVALSPSDLKFCTYAAAKSSF